MEASIGTTAGAVAALRAVGPGVEPDAGTATEIGVEAAAETGIGPLVISAGTGSNAKAGIETAAGADVALRTVGPGTEPDAGTATEIGVEVGTETGVEAGAETSVGIGRLVT